MSIVQKKSDNYIYGLIQWSSLGFSCYNLLQMTSNNRAKRIQYIVKYAPFTIVISN